MTEIIDLKAKRDERRLILVCTDCNCTTMTLFADGSVACAACELELTAAGSEWRERLAPAPEEAKPVDGFKVIPLRTPKDSLLRWAASPDVTRTKAILLMLDDGAVMTSWFGDRCESEEDRDWLLRRFGEAFKLFTA